MKLRNMTSTLKDELGSDWKDKLEQYQREIDYCKEHGLPHPAFSMLSGGVRPEVYPAFTENYNEDVSEKNGDDEENNEISEPIE